MAANDGNKRFEVKRQRAQAEGVYEDAKDYARSRRDDGNAYVSEDDLDRALRDAGVDPSSVATSSNSFTSSSSGLIYNSYPNSVY